MSAVLAPPRRRRGATRQAEALPQAALFADAPLDERLEAPPSLDEVITHGWEGLATGIAMACPVCRSELVPDAAGGSCVSCGASLS